MNGNLNRKYRIIISFLFLFPGFSSFGQGTYNFNDRCIDAYYEVINLRFASAEKMIEGEKKSDPANIVPWYLDNFILFLKLAVSEDETLYENTGDQRKIIMDHLEKGNESSPYHKYFLAHAHLQWCFVKAKFKDYISSLMDANSAYRLLEDNHERFPDFPPNMINLGLMHALIGTIPDNYQWIRKIIGLEGTIPQGINEIQNALEKVMKDPRYSFYETECLIYLSFIQFNLTPDKKKALSYTGSFMKNTRTSQSPLVIYAMARIFMNAGMNDKAVEVLLSKPRSTEYFPFHYLDYLTGQVKMNRLDKDAVGYFLDYIVHFRGINYIKAAYQKVAWCFLLKGETAKYEEYIAKALTNGNRVVDDDLLAEREAKTHERPNVTLLKARLLFDGGYYEKAAGMLTLAETSHFLAESRDTLEYHYRLGRIYHEWGKTGEAVTHYQHTMDKGAGSPYFYAANAALKLGTIYEEAGQYAKARECYTKAQQMKNEEYRNSINQKAKAGLNRIAGK